MTSGADIEEGEADCGRKGGSNARRIILGSWALAVPPRVRKWGSTGGNGAGRLVGAASSMSGLGVAPGLTERERGSSFPDLDGLPPPGSTLEDPLPEETSLLEDWVAVRRTWWCRRGAAITAFGLGDVGGGRDCRC
ncbi:hypothetical protein MLD38_038182 [Melastoma candidum]|uniref:Uncharacterized protein n=1 Tax=Melastoma candidum TaxID=119954 RepID=A0ACB9KZA5_9MYRT|nr:hypothetical protein MLD38_038182 [Melastoma candidum]